MKGKILDTGIIAGNDNNRYSFTKEDIKNLDTSNLENLIDLEVDFIIKEDKAIEIYIENSISNPFKIISSDNIKSIRMKYFIGMGANMLTPIPFIGWILALIGTVLKLLAIISLQKISNSKNLLKNFIIASTISLISSIVMIISGISGLMSNQGTSDLSYIIVIGVILNITAIIFWYKYYTELKSITGENLFKIAFYFYAIGFLTLIFGLGFIFLIIANILEFMAWYRIKDIKKVN